MQNFDFLESWHFTWHDVQIYLSYKERNVVVV